MEYKKVSEEVNNIVSDNIKALEQLFPGVIKDGQLDLEALKEEIGQFEPVDKEKYDFTWSGKQNAKKLAQEDVYNRTLNFDAKDSKNPDTTENLYIEGDNLEVLKLLRQNYYNSIKMIYIDPPYNTGNDFVYNDKFTMIKEESDIAEGYVSNDNERLQKNLTSSNRFHANWLNMMYPRLRIARDLLTDDGVIFISIDDHEVENLRKACDDIFGEQNFIGQTIRVSSPTQNIAKFISIMHDYTLVYCKNKISNNGNWSVKKNYADEFERRANQLIKQGLSEDEITAELRALTKYPRFFDFDHYTMCDKNGVFQLVSMGGVSKGNTESILIHPITNKPCTMPQGGWRYKNDALEELNKKDLIYFGKDENYVPRKKLYLHDYLEQIPKGVNFYDTQSDIHFLKENNIPFDFPKPKEYIEYFLKMIGLSDDDIVLDFFSGSATTAHAVMQLNAEDGGNRKFIMVQIPEKTEEKSEAYKAGYRNICEIGKERIRRAGELIKSEIEKENQNLKIGEEPKKIPDIGFKVFKTADTNIKWNLVSDVEEFDLNTLMDAPDNIDFTFGARDIDIVYEIMLRQRDVSLSETFEILSDIGERTYLYGSSYLVSLETEITEEMVEKLASLDPLPIKFVFRDSAFKDDINLKDKTFRTLKALVERNSGESKQTYTVEFI